MTLMQNHSEIAEFLWKIADLIKDDYEAKDYEDVILPFTLLRRLDCVLEPTRAAAGAESMPKMNMVTVIGSRKRPEAVTLAPNP